MLYASLTGPLLGLYFPIPTENKILARFMLNSSKLQKLWCSLYDEKETNILCSTYGGTKLPKEFMFKLDYDYCFCEETYNKICNDGPIEKFIIRS